MGRFPNRNESGTYVPDVRTGSPSDESRLVRDLVAVSRPGQWLKNVFVLAPLVFAPQVWSRASLASSLAALVCFCLWSSCVYIFNDLIDVESDRAHPRKRHRPIAAGRLQPAAAMGLLASLSAVTFLLSIAVLPMSFVACGGGYLATSVAYCLVLKHRVIADVLTISIGFVIRLAGGCFAIGVEPSSWIIICGFSLALLLGFGKRRCEIERLDGDQGAYRPTLLSYSVAKLDAMLTISAAICILSYMLYTMAPETIEMHQTRRLIFTVPFVCYGVFRFIFKAQEGAADGPVEILSRDPVFLVNGLLWVAAAAGIIALAK
jgi:4-hydroxybenzoate polyprenyltransferase